MRVRAYVREQLERLSSSERDRLAYRIGAAVVIGGAAGVALAVWWVFR